MGFVNRKRNLFSPQKARECVKRETVSYLQLCYPHIPDTIVGNVEWMGVGICDNVNTGYGY